MHNDDTAKFRNLTLLYLEHRIAALREVKEKLDESPTDEGLRRQWVELVAEFGERASHLSREWKDRYPSQKERAPAETQPVARIHLNTVTPT